jgi:hypothetical protein
MTALSTLYRVMLRFTAFWLLTVALLGDDPAAAVLASVEGNVTVTSPEGRAVKAQVFDWLKTGTSLETAAGSRAVVVLANGKRYQVAERSRAIIETGVVRRVAGKVQPQPGLAEIPKLAAIADAAANAHAGTVRIRGPQLRNCYPSPDATLLASRAMISFDPSAEVRSYQVEVEDEAGNVIHHAESPGAAVTLPPDLLKPGKRYYYEVRGVVPVGEAPRCAAEFATLPEEDEMRRAILKTAVHKAGDADSLALLAEVDRRLGLLREAREEFTSALKGSSAPDAIRAALQKLAAVTQ